MAKKKKTYKGKSLAVGGGGQFQKMVDSIMKSNPNMSEQMAKAIAANAGRKKYGKVRFQKMAVAGKKRAAKRK